MEVTHSPTKSEEKYDSGRRMKQQIPEKNTSICSKENMDEYLSKISTTNSWKNTQHSITV